MTLISKVRTVLVLSILLGACSSRVAPDTQNFDKPKAAKTRLSLGLTYLENGNFSQAKFNLDKALEFAPRSAQNHYGMAYYYQTVEDFTLAEQSYQTAMDLAPRDADIANSYGAFLCARGKYAKAKKYFEQAINSDSYISAAETYENLALCSQRHGQLQEALDYLNSALNHQPGRAKSLFLLADLYLADNQLDKARDAMARYEKVSRVSGESLWLASRIEQAGGNVQGATDYANMIINLFPTYQPAKNYLASLDEQGRAKPSAQKVSKPTTSIQNKTEPKVQTQASAQDPLDKNRYHVVQKQENLYRISLLYNVKIQSLMDWNNISDPSAIYVGKKLIVVDPEMKSSAH